MGHEQKPSLFLLMVLAKFLKRLVSWCFEPSQPQRITSGISLKRNSRPRLESDLLVCACVCVCVCVCMLEVIRMTFNVVL